MELGETDYSFENFVVTLLTSESYETQVGTII